MGKKDKYGDKNKKPAPVVQQVQAQIQSLSLENPQIGQGDVTGQSSAAQAPTKRSPKGKMSTENALKVIDSKPDGSGYEGSRGVKCKLEVNYLKINTKNLVKKAFHYDVSFEPEIPRKMLSTAFSTFMSNNFSSWQFAFDSRKSFYTSRLLEVNGAVLEGSFEREVTAVMGDRSKDFKVKVQFATEVDMVVLGNFWDKIYQRNVKPSQAIQCLDVILRTAFKPLTDQKKAVAVGRSLYFNTRAYPLGEGMEMWLGLFQSALLGRRSLYLNVDVSHKAFPCAVPVKELFEKLRCDERKLHEYLDKLTINYKLLAKDPVKTYSYYKLVRDEKNVVMGADRARFENEAGEKMTVADYFKKVKKNPLKHPELPVLHVGSRARNIYMPMEFCSVADSQATNKKVTPNCVAKMITYSATSTEVRKDKIMSLLDHVKFDKSGGEIKNFGIEVVSGFHNVEARVIPPPLIQYQNGTEKLFKGTWRGQSFMETPQQVVKWAVINCDDRTNIGVVKDLCGMISAGANNQKMMLSKFAYDKDYVQLTNPNHLDQTLDKFKEGGYRLVFVIIVDRNNCYAKIKQAAELRVGILTQCIKAETVTKTLGARNPMMTIGNIMLKVNAKLNGKNHEVKEPSYNALKNAGVMFIGADVTHPTPDQRHLPSVVGVAASYDQVGFKYQCAWRIQDGGEEMIQDLEDIVVEQLQLYKKTNNKLPAVLMYYRDGVSDGQFGTVLDIELSALRAAIARVYGPKNHAKVTFIVVQKRHHTRFFPQARNGPASGWDKRDFNNVQPGTVVDKDIVHPFQNHFFMVSHAAIQGVARPTKYCILKDDSGMLPDDLQAITHDLCHLFTRCNRAVSYPAPTYYAHLVAARGKNYTIGYEVAGKEINRAFQQQSPMFFV